MVIPTFNKTSLLRICLESVFSQHYKNLEVIVIDDGSTDNTSETIEKVFFHNTNLKEVYFRKDGSMELTPWRGSNRGVTLALEKYLGKTFNENKEFVDYKRMVYKALSLLQRSHNSRKSQFKFTSQYL